MEILDTCDNLVQEIAGFCLFNSMISYNIIEEFTTLGIFHDQIQLLWCLNYLIKLNDIGMPDHLKYMNFTSHSFNIIDILYLIFLQNLNSNFFTGETMDAQLDFAKCTFSDSFIFIRK